MHRIIFNTFENKTIILKSITPRNYLLNLVLLKPVYKLSTPYTMTQHTHTYTHTHTKDEQKL